jgi:hypothetical protein
MNPKSLSELAALIDLLRDKCVAHFELGDLKLVLGSPFEEMSEPAAASEDASPRTGLTPSQEKEWFHSSE